MTCAICGEPAEAGPMCRDCAEERANHRSAKAKHRAELARRRHERTEEK